MTATPVVQHFFDEETNTFIYVVTDPATQQAGACDKQGKCTVGAQPKVQTATCPTPITTGAFDATFTLCSSTNGI